MIALKECGDDQNAAAKWLLDNGEGIAERQKSPLVRRLMLDKVHGTLCQGTHADYSCGDSCSTRLTVRVARRHVRRLVLNTVLTACRVTSGFAVRS